jgi:hypothetical protein
VIISWLKGEFFGGRIMAGHTKFAMFALVMGMSATAFGTVTVTETFDTDPSSRGWSGVGNETAPNNYGYSPTDNTGSSVNPTIGTATGAGEIGGSINRGPNSTYGVDLGGPVDFATTDMDVQGVLRLDSRGSSTTLSLGWGQGISTVIGDGTDNSGAFLGMRWDDGYNGAGAMQARGNNFGIEGADGPSLPDPNAADGPQTIPFDMNWVASTRTLTMDLNGSKGTMVINEGDMGDLPALDHWQMFGRSGATPDNANVLWLDDLRYTAVSTPAPEPASLGLLAIGAVAGLGRRRRR